jgi:predicted nucleotidyltransferase
MDKNFLNKIITKVFFDIDYKKIFLFGSRARQEYADKSDYDFMVIINNEIKIKDKIKLMSKLRERFAELLIDADIIIKSDKEFNYYQDKVGEISQIVKNEGVLLSG